MLTNSSGPWLRSRQTKPKRTKGTKATQKLADLRSIKAIEECPNTFYKLARTIWINR